MIVAIDGPAGSGKSTIAKILAERLGALYIDTGAMYRALTYKVLTSDIDLQDKEKIYEIARNTKLDFVRKGSTYHILLDGKDVNEEIRKPEVSAKVFYVADYPKIRGIMVFLQRKLSTNENVVIEGRDTTTVVFPEAKYKFFLDAEFSERVRRRQSDLLNKGIKISWEELSQSLAERDRKDKTRPVGALKQARGAIYIDTTKLSIEEVVNKLLEIINKKDV